jgi:hypothetical protein
MGNFADKGFVVDKDNPPAEENGSDHGSTLQIVLSTSLPSNLRSNNRVLVDRLRGSIKELREGTPRGTILSGSSPDWRFIPAVKRERRFGAKSPLPSLR